MAVGGNDDHVLLRRRYDAAHGMDRDLLHGAVGQLSIVSPEFVCPRNSSPEFTEVSPEFTEEIGGL
jgi:hypothetical protein